MTTFTRAAGKAFFKALDAYENQKKLVERAVDPVKPTLIKSHAKNREKLEECFLDLSHDWKVYKQDLGVTKEEFNSNADDGFPAYEYNDAWFSNMENDYFL